MKLQLIHTENYLIAVDDSKIEGGNKSLLILEGFQDGEPMILSHWQGVEDGYLGKKITHHLPLNNAPVLEGIELLPPLEDDMVRFLDFSKSTNWEKSIYEARCILNGKHIESKEILRIWKEQKPNLPTSFDTETKQYIYATHN